VWAIAQDSESAVWRLVYPLYLLFMTLCYFNTMLLFIMFLVCSSCMLDIVITDDEYMHMFAKRFAQYSSELSGCWHFLAPLLKIELILLLAMTLEMVW
jgi:hypothetical protein